MKQIRVEAETSLFKPEEILTINDRQNAEYSAMNNPNGLKKTEVEETKILTLAQT